MKVIITKPSWKQISLVRTLSITTLPKMYTFFNPVEFRAHLFHAHTSFQFFFVWVCIKNKAINCYLQSQHHHLYSRWVCCYWGQKIETILQPSYFGIPSTHAWKWCDYRKKRMIFYRSATIFSTYVFFRDFMSRIFIYPLSNLVVIHHEQKNSILWIYNFTTKQ